MSRTPIFAPQSGPDHPRRKTLEAAAPEPILAPVHVQNTGPFADLAIKLAKIRRQSHP